MRFSAHQVILPRQKSRYSHGLARTGSLVNVSEYIHNSLYDSQNGYFSKVDVITSPNVAIKFGDVLGKAEYQHIVHNIYRDHGTAWSTPVELFAPWYSRALARYLLQWLTSQRAVADPKQPLVVYELGGGLGTNARHICDYLRASAPSVYRSLTYTILEISPKLRAAQEAALVEHRACARSVLMDAMQLGSVSRGLVPHAPSSTSSPGGSMRVQPDRQPCVVMALEVLDNLPHDKVVALAGKDGGPVQLYEAFVEHSGSDTAHAPSCREVYRPLRTGLAEEVSGMIGVDMETGSLSHETAAGKAPARYLGGSLLSRIAMRLPFTSLGVMPPAPEGLVWARYVPTGCLRLLRSLQEALPRHHLLLADFTELPAPRVLMPTVRADTAVEVYAPAAGAPVVASKAGGVTVDHATYMSPRPGSADIFFPTDFRALARMVDAVRGGTPVVSATGSGGQAGDTKTSGGARASRARIQSSAAFLAAFAEVERTRTLTGYNPMLHDYPNTAILTR